MCFVSDSGIGLLIGASKVGSLDLLGSELPEREFILDDAFCLDGCVDFLVAVKTLQFRQR